MVRLAQRPAVDDDAVARREARVARGFHGAREVDAGDQREALDDGRRAGERHAVLVVHGRPFDGDHDVAFGQEIVGAGFDGCVDGAVVGAGCNESAECHAGPFSVGKAEA